jgi:MFS family permease
MKIKSFYTSQFFRSLAEAMISPFLSVYFIFLGATKALVGLASSLPELASLFSQLFWGSLSEGINRKSILIILGGIAWALIWIPIALTKDPIQLILLLTVQAIISAASIPAWTGLLIRLVPGYKIASAQGNLNVIGNFASLTGTLIAGLLLNQFGFIPFIFFIIAFLGIMSRIPFFTIKEPKIFSANGEFKIVLKRTFDFSWIKKEKELINLIAAITFLNFSVSLAAPFLSVYVVTNLKGDLASIAMISVIGAITVIIFSRPWGAVIERGGRKFVMLACLIPVSFIPFIYAIAPDMNWIYFYQLVGTMSWTGFNLAVFIHLANILPKEKMDSSISFYNLFTGLGSASGPFIGGMISEFIGLRNLFFLSTFLRLFTLGLIEKVEERPGLARRNSWLGLEFLGLAYRIENLISVYSLVMIETLRQSIDFFNFKKHFKKPNFSWHKGSKRPGQK